MGCGPSRATEASAYGVDAAGRVPDAPSAGRQTPKCSRVPDACPQPDAPHPGGTQSDAPSRAKRHRSLCAPRDDDLPESLIRVVERGPPDVPSTSARRIRLSSLAATHPLATPMASPSAPHRPNLARWTERDDPNFTDLALSRSFSNSVATSSFASLSAKALIETETTDETVGDDEMMSEDEDAKDDEDEDDETAYREVLAAAAAAVREAVDAVRVAAAPRFDTSGKEKPNHKRLSASTNALNDENDTHTHRENDDVIVPSSIPEGAPRSIPVRDETSDATEMAFRRETNEKPTRGAVERIAFLEETLCTDESGYRFVPGVGVTTSRRAPAAAVAKTAMDLARRAGRLEQTRAIRF